MSGDKYVTVSKVIMLAHGLSSACTKIKATVTTQLANVLVDTLLAIDVKKNVFYVFYSRHVF